MTSFVNIINDILDFLFWYISRYQYWKIICLVIISVITLFFSIIWLININTAHHDNKCDNAIENHDNVNERLSIIGGNFNVIDERIDVLFKRINVIEKRTDMMDNNIDLLHKRMDIIKKRMERVNEKIINLINYSN
ncbi:unnamed protein product [Rhizophagus irregularis]|nr:unnamed protein product [Rhizophagus irregularis]CAB5364595.1 unnamed protein product [Rhizophagus irregularis]